MLVTSLPAVIRAKEYKFDKFKCSITLPENWRERDPQGRNEYQILFASNEANTKAFALMIAPIRKDQTVHNPELIKGLQDAIRAKPEAQISLIKGEYITFKSLPAYSQLLRMVQNESGDSVWSYSIIVVANGYGYSFSCAGGDIVPTDDPLSAYNE